MPDNQTLGANFSIDISSLKAGLAQANRLIKESQSEFKAAAAGMGDWRTSADGVTAKIKQLNTTIGLQEAKVEALEENYRSLIADGLDPASAEAVKLRTQINNEKAALESNRKELKNQTDALLDLTTETEVTRTASEKLRDEISKQEQELDDLKEEYRNVVLEQGKSSTAAKELKAQISSLNDELKNNKKKLDDAGEELEDLGEEAKDAGDGFTIAKGAIAGFIANGLTALIGKVGEAISSIANLSQETQEYREDIAKLQTAFETAGHTTEEATKTYKELYSVFGEEDRAVEAAQQIAALAKNEEEMATMTEIATGAWAKWGDSLATESLMEAVNSTAKIGEVQGTLADALEWSGVNLDAFNGELEKMSTEEERSAYILDILNGLYSDQAQNYRKNNESIIQARKATSDYTDAMAKLGEKAEPITTKVREGFTRILEKIMELLNKADFDKFGNAIEKAFDVVIDSILPALFKGIEWLIDNGKVVIDVLRAIAIGFAAFKVAHLIMSAVTAIKGMVSALKAATTAQQALNSAQKANIIAAIAAAVLVLVDACIRWAQEAENVVHEWDKLNSAIEKNTATNQKWFETMDSARATLGDYADMTNAAGESTDDLRGRMEEAQAGITKIFQEAFVENRELREEEIESIKKFNEDYIAAQRELQQLETAQLQAQTDSLQWQLDNLELSAEERQGILNSLQEVQGAYVEKMDGYVAEEIALLDMRLQKGQITEEEYKIQREKALESQRGYRDQSKLITQGTIEDALAQQREMVEIDAQTFTNRDHTFKSLEEIQAHYAEKIDRINKDESLSWWDKVNAVGAASNEMRDAMLGHTLGMEQQWTDYNFITDQNISENTAAFFQWAADTAAAGIELDEENKAIAKAILAAYEDLPEDLQESGLESLRGLAEGMADEVPELEKAGEMNMEDLLAAMNKALGVQSPSWKMKNSGKNVMQGLEDGLEGRQKTTNSVASRIASGLLGIFSSIFQEASPSKAMKKKGLNLGKGLEIGLTKSTKGVVAAAKKQVGSLNAVYDNANFTANANLNTNGTASGVNGGGMVVVNQTNNYHQEHTRYELYKTKHDTYSAVQLALGGAR